MKTCKLESTGKRHYEVVSPEYQTYPGSPYGSMPEPPEWGRDWALIEAGTRREAVMLAVKMPKGTNCTGFQGWIQDNRSDNKPPWAGLRARPFVCPHGVCWGCDTFCNDCDKEYDENS